MLLVRDLCVRRIQFCRKGVDVQGNMCLMRRENKVECGVDDTCSAVTSFGVGYASWFHLFASTTPTKQNIQHKRKGKMKCLSDNLNTDKW